MTVVLQSQAEFNSSLVRSQTNTADIRGLKPGTIYVFQVRARTVAGFGRYSGKMYFQTMTEGIPPVLPQSMQYSTDHSNCGSYLFLNVWFAVCVRGFKDTAVTGTFLFFSYSF